MLLESEEGRFISPTQNPKCVFMGNLINSIVGLTSKRLKSSTIKLWTKYQIALICFGAPSFHPQAYVEIQRFICFNP